jgi:HK97 family phage major capsid protein/HK97 family phage prohead protease
MEMKEGRAFSMLNVKEIAETPTSYIIKGIASTPTPDRTQDVVDPMGAKFTLPMPLLLYHNSRMPVGQLTTAKAQKNGIPFTAELPKVTEPGVVQDRINEAIHSIKYRLIAAVSIGFRAMKDGYEMIAESDYGIKYTNWEWLELSLVTIPANPEAVLRGAKSFTLDHFKQFDQDQRAASGMKPVTVVPAAKQNSAGVTATSTHEPKGKAMNTKEQIASFEAKRAANVAAMKEMMDKAGESQSTLTQEESDKYDSLAAEIKQVDTHLDRLRAHEELLVDKAVAITADAGTGETKSKQVRQGDGVIKVNPNIPKGLAFTRLACALALSKGVTMQALQYAQRWKDETPEVGNFLDVACKMGGTTGWMQPDGPLASVQKATVAAGNTTDTNWASPLVQYNNMASEFVNLLRPRTILGQLQGLRNVPFNIRFPSQSSGSSMGWVGQGAGKPVSKLQFSTNTLGFAKAAGIVVITKELAMLSSPSAEMLVQNDMLDSMSQFLDQQFIGPSVAAVANVSPASITNGLTSQNQATGSTLATFEVDIATAMAVLVAGEIPFTSAVWITDPYTAMKIGMLRQSDGDLTFPNVSINGGTLYGVPLIASNNIPHSTSAGSIMVLVATPEIFLADEGGIEIDSSQEASLQMDGAPTNADGTPTTLVSLWQTNMLGIRVERVINWQRRRTAAVTYIDNLHL